MCDVSLNFEDTYKYLLFLIPKMKKIAINFFELILSKDSLNVPHLLVHSFDNKIEVMSIRKNNPNTFLSHSRDKVYFWGENNFSKSFPTEIDIENDSNLFLKFFSESLLKQFRNTDKFRVKKEAHSAFYKITFFDNDVSNGKYKGLILLKNFHIHFTKFNFDNNEHLGFTIATSISVRSRWKKEDFIKNGIEIDGLEFDEKTEEVFSFQKVKYILASHFNYSSKLKDDLDKLNSIQNEYQDVNTFVKEYFEKQIDNFILPDNLKILNFKKTCFLLTNSEGNFQNEVLVKPERFYRNGNTPDDSSISHIERLNIKNNKPFTYDDFENKELKINIIVPTNCVSKTKDFFEYVKKQMKYTFGIKKIESTGKPINDFSLSSYQEVLNKINNVDLVMVVVDESHEVLSPNNSPYYFCKSKFLERGINTQEIQIQRIEEFLSDKKLNAYNFTDDNISLNMYAKLGGMAWTIKPNESKNELIIGIGATTNDEGQPILGLTSIFRGDGKYLLGKVFSVTGMEDYKKNLEKILISTIDKSIEDGSLETENPFSLIFHIFKPAGKDNEIAALQNVIAKYSSYSFEYTFVHIGDGHNYRFFTFDEVNGLPKFEMKSGFGQNYRGTFIKINNNLGFLGLQANNSVFLKIAIDERSSVFKLEYVANQVYQFAEMSHTSYNKSGRPVTIKYPNLMAGFAEKFNDIDGFYLKKIEVPDNSLWFI